MYNNNRTSISLDPLLSLRFRDKEYCTPAAFINISGQEPPNTMPVPHQNLKHIIEFLFHLIETQHFWMDAGQIRRNWQIDKGGRGFKRGQANTTMCTKQIREHYVTYRGEDFTDGCLNLELGYTTIHVRTQHECNRLQGNDHSVGRYFQSELTRQGHFPTHSFTPTHHPPTFVSLKIYMTLYL